MSATPKPPLHDPWDPMDPYRAEQRLERRRRLNGLRPRTEREILIAVDGQELRFGAEGNNRTFKARS